MSDYGWREFHYQRLTMKGQPRWEWTWFRMWGTTRKADDMLGHLMMFPTVRHASYLEINDQDIHTAPKEPRNAE